MHMNRQRAFGQATDATQARRCVLFTKGWLNGRIETTPDRLAPEFSARFVDLWTSVSRGSLRPPYSRQPGHGGYRSPVDLAQVNRGGSTRQNQHDLARTPRGAEPPPQSTPTARVPHSLGSAANHVTPVVPAIESVRARGWDGTSPLGGCSGQT
jgi:hypothetical protein